ncbi:MAG: DinB family protein [Chloroflexota bacterium]
MTVEERIQRLELSVRGLLEHIQSLPADALYGEPGAGEWPVMSTLAHLAELLPYWAHQAELIARTPGAAFGRTHDDAQRVGAVEQHGRDSLEAIVPRIHSGLNEAVTALRGLPSAAWTRAGQHATRGGMTVEQVVDTCLINHAEEHATQIQATLEALRADRP